MAQKDELTERTGPGRIAPKYAAQQTLQYKTFVKRTMVEALQNAFGLYEDSTLAKVKAAIDYSNDRADFPAVIVKFYERTIQNAGVGHVEWGPDEGELILSGQGTLVAGSGEITGLETTEDIYPGVTAVKGIGIPPRSFVLRVLSSSSILINKLAYETGQFELHFQGAVNLNTKFIEYHHSIYHGDIAFEVYGMSSVDRDKTADALVEIVQMGSVGLEGLNFQERIYHTIGLTPYSNWHFITVNTDLLSGYGEREEAPPWGPEDALLYRVEYRIPVIGEFYSITPKTTPGKLGLIKEVDLYPWSPQNPYDTPPDEFPGGVVPKSQSIHITHHAEKNPYRIVTERGASQFSVTMTPVKL